MAQIVKSIVGLGISFAPVPGLNVAFETLDFIWQHVQQAKSNREALTNLTISTAEILIAIDRVLSQRQFNEHIRTLLRSLQQALDEFLLFAKEHVSMHFLKALIKDVDVEGKIEQFQNRLQNLMMAFNITALGSIDNQLNNIQGHLQVKDLPALPPSGRNSPSPARWHNQKKTKPIADYESARVNASFSEPCTMELKKGAPFLTCRYFKDVDLKKTWGLRRPDSKFVKTDDGFYVTQGTESWMWNLAWKKINVRKQDSSNADLKDTITMVFENKKSAGDWYTWLRSYASLQTVSAPPSCDVWVRKNYDCWTRKTTSEIQRQVPRSSRWMPVLGGTLESSSVYATHFTYIQSGLLPFTRVYRSGDTLVIERFNREDEEEPVVARRYRFASDDVAQSWYAAWRDCIMSSRHGSEPVKVQLTTKDQGTLVVRNNEPILDSPLSHDGQLRNWGLRRPRATVRRLGTGFEVSTMVASWSWVPSGKQVTVLATLSAQPDVHDRFELVFREHKAAAVWFTYLVEYVMGGSSLAPPHPEHVAVTKTRVCWMQNTVKSIETRTAMSDKWHPALKKYKRIEVHPTHIIATMGGPAPLPHHRIGRDGRVLYVERRHGGEAEAAVREEYRFDREVDARVWFDRWKTYLTQKGTA